jgi:outer membrane protein OmpA-like peptidoglycan-associated protein
MKPERSKRFLGVPVSLVLTLGWAGCATNTGKGAAIGAGGGGLLGAGIGALAGGGKGAVIGGVVGAGVGAGAGALIGNYMDKQEAELKKMKAANVERKGDQLVVRFKSEILFDTNKADLKPASQSDLAEFANVLKQYPETNLVIQGHTDSKGKKANNEKLSRKRAESVMSALSANGVASTRMTAEGYADNYPVADNSTPEGRQKNRRVEVQIAANEKLQQQAQQRRTANP